jgi:hypothetical protein
MGDRVPVVVGDLVPVDLDSAGVLIECRLLLEEDLPDLVQSFLWAITSMTLLDGLTLLSDDFGSEG